MNRNEYRKLVLDDFEKKLASGVLSPELTAPTRAGLRDHCINVCKERYQKKDEPLLKSFYGERDNPSAYLIAVQNCDAEKFRNLNNFLKTRSKGTSFTSISMLAWMIDFEPRPFHENLKVPVLPEPEVPSPPAGSDSVEPVNDPPVLEMQVHPEPAVPQPSSEMGISEPADEPPVTETQLPPPGVRKIWPWLAALLLVMGITYYFITRDRTLPGDKGGCMVWTGEEYQSVSCTYKPEDRTVQVIALDTAVQIHFKKIMKDDTLTADAIGKVWCVKIDGRYEYYTDSAAHPLYPEKILRPLTQFIMNNNPPSGR